MSKNLFSIALSFLLATVSLQAETAVYLPYECHLASPERSNLLVFEDGSEWKVSDYDAEELASWYAEGDVVSVTLSPHYFSVLYTYYLTNNRTGSYVRANLVGAPVRGSPHAVTIVGVDYSPYGRGNLFLSNGTFWHISALDQDSMRRWYVGDLIIIGKNTEWFSFNSHILINIHTNTFVRAQRI